MTSSYSNNSSVSSGSNAISGNYKTTSEPRIQNVTEQIEKIHRIYGASDYTAPQRHAAGRSLNYATGASMQRAEREPVTVIPYNLEYKDTVGLFGAENHFVRVDLRIKGDVLRACYEEERWECAALGERNPEEIAWYGGYININHDEPIERDFYEQAAITENKLKGTNGYVSIELTNNKIGIHQNDAWLDVRLYTEGRQEHPYNKMYVKSTDSFYIGFHARNTRRLGYDVECLVGGQYLQYDEIEDKRLIMQR